MNNKKICSFFGHSKSYGSVRPYLEATLKYLIEKRNITSFYVGHQGSFDSEVCSVLKKFKLIYPHIDYSIVLAYFPTEKKNLTYELQHPTVYPSELEKVPKKFAISQRNKWIIKNSDIIVCYIICEFASRSAKFVNMAKNQGKEIINLADFIE